MFRQFQIRDPAENDEDEGNEGGIGRRSPSRLEGRYGGSQNVSRVDSHFSYHSDSDSDSEN